MPSRSMKVVAVSMETATATMALPGRAAAETGSPSLPSLRGQSPAQESRCPTVGN